MLYVVRYEDGYNMDAADYREWLTDHGIDPDATYVTQEAARQAALETRRKLDCEECRVYRADDADYSDCLFRRRKREDVWYQVVVTDEDECYEPYYAEGSHDYGEAMRLADEEYAKCPFDNAVSIETYKNENCNSDDWIDTEVVYKPREFRPIDQICFQSAAYSYDDVGDLFDYINDNLFCREDRNACKQYIADYIAVHPDLTFETVNAVTRDIVDHIEDREDINLVAKFQTDFAQAALKYVQQLPPDREPERQAFVAEPVYKIKGLKKAVDEYRWANSQDDNSWYGYLMLDRDTGRVWTDEFYSLGHNQWKEYHDPAVIDLGDCISGDMTVAAARDAAICEIAAWGRERDGERSGLLDDNDKSTCPTAKQTPEAEPAQPVRTRSR